jgi:ribosomal-protein-serine acetyltransferase
MFYIKVDDDITLHLVQEHHYPIIFTLIENNRDHLEAYNGEMDKTLDDVHQRCLRSKEIFAKNGTLITLITYQGQPAGSINLHYRTGGTISGVEIGYWLAKEFVGKGIMTNATRAMTDYAFAHMDVNRVFLGIATNNPRSYAIPERLGFTLEGTIHQNEKINGEWVNHRLYTMLKDDWTALQDPPILRYPIDGNLDLRLIEKRHAEALFALCDNNREHIGEWLPWIDDTQSVNDTMGFIEESLKQYGENNGFQLGIWQDNQLVGMIGYLYWNFANKHTEIGYWLAKDTTGKGIITQCTHALVDYAFNTLNLNRIVIRCAVDNEKSGNVAKRLGFTHEGIERQGIKLRDTFTDLHVYSILAEEWQTS